MREKAALLGVGGKTHAILISCLGQAIQGRWLLFDLMGRKLISFSNLLLELKITPLFFYSSAVIKRI